MRHLPPLTPALTPTLPLPLLLLLPLTRCATFYLWSRALRSAAAWPYALLCGVAYAYMVAAWGGYLFVLNMIGVHALTLVRPSPQPGPGATLSCGATLTPTLP